jgi:hypothetical protein
MDFPNRSVIFGHQHAITHSPILWQLAKIRLGGNGEIPERVQPPLP